MSGMRAKVILLVGIAAVGMVLFSFAHETAGSRGGGWLDPSAPPASGWGVKRNLVQLPQPTGAAAFGGLPKPTGAPLSGHAGQPEQRNADSADEVVPVEDPYAG